MKRLGRSCVALLAATSFASATPVVPAAAQGPNWSAGVLPSGIGSLSAISCQPIADSQRCVAVGQNATGSAASIVVGGDGGRSWQLEQAPPGVTGLFGVSCVSAQRCWAVGTSAGGTQGVVVDTKDGGATWVIQFMPLDLSEIDRISCSSSTCLATGGSLAGQVLGTDDGGARWSVRRLPGIFAATNATAVSATVAYAVGGNQCGGPHVTECPGAIWRSNDGGSTWQLITHGIPFADAISCADASRCLAASATFKTGVIEATSDGGQHWHSQKLPGFRGFFNSVSCHSSDCAAVGQNAGGTAPVIVRTRDGGKYWTLDSPPRGTGALYGVAATGAGEGQAVGQNPAKSAATVLQVQVPAPRFSHSGALGGATLAALREDASLSGSLAGELSRTIAAICNATADGCGAETLLTGRFGGIPIPLSSLQSVVHSLDQYSSSASAVERSVRSLLAGPATRQARERMRDLATQLSFEAQREFTEAADLDAAWEGTGRQTFTEGLSRCNHAGLSAVSGMRSLAIGLGSSWP